MESRSGPFAQYGPLVASYLQTSLAPLANVEIFTQPACFGGEISCGDGSDLSAGITQEVDVFVMLMLVNSSGSLTLLGEDGKPFPTAYGDLYLSADEDQVALVEAVMKVGAALLGSSAGLVANVTAVNPRSYDETTAKAHVLGSWGTWSHMQASHFSGTCAFGPRDEGGCADATRAGAVYGVRGVHVADASLSPRPIVGHPIATVMAVAEKVARDLSRDVPPGS